MKVHNNRLRFSLASFVKTNFRIIGNTVPIDKSVDQSLVLEIMHRQILTALSVIRNLRNTMRSLSMNLHVMTNRPRQGSRVWDS